MDIREKVVTALKWTATARLAGQITSWVVTIFVIRILSPGDYGLMAMAMVFIAVLYLLHNAGLDSVLIQKKNLDELTRRRIFGAVILINLSIFVSLAALAPYIAWFFDEPELTTIIRVLSCQFLFLMFETLPLARLEKELDFKRRSIIDFSTMLAGSLMTLSLALAGYGVWALVWGNLFMLVIRTVGLNIIAPYQCWPSFRLRGIGREIIFGSHFSAERVFWFIFSDSDKFIGGKFLGKDLLGYYAVANHLASLPINKLGNLINSVAFPAFANVQEDMQKVTDYLLKSIRLASTFSFPVFIGMSCTAPEIVTVILGAKWTAAGVPLQLLALVMPIRLISALLPPALGGIGRPDVSAGNFLIAAMVMPVAFLIGCQWGVLGLTLAWVVAYPVVFLAMLIRTARVIGTRVSLFVQAMSAPLLPAAGMYLAVSATRTVTGDFNQQAVLMILIAVGALTYSSLLFILDRDGIREAMELIRP